MFELLITPKHDCAIAKTRYNAEAIISIQDYDDNAVETPKGFSVGWHRHFHFDDLCEEYGYRPSSNDPNIMRLKPPTKDDVEAILSFAKLLDLAGTKKVLIHCFAGVSRSSGAAVAIYAQMLGPGKEDEAMKKAETSAVYGGIWPNGLVIQYADELLKRDGALIKAVQAWKDHEKGKSKGVSF